MISRFFGTTKPINYLVLFLFLLFFFLAKFFILAGSDWSLNMLATTGLAFVALIVQIYLVNEMARKANLNDISSFPMLFFTLLIIAFSEVLSDWRIIICNLFLILCINDLLTINSSKKTNVKVFNASLWLAIATLSYPFAILFYLPTYFAIYFYCGKTLRNWLMPLAAVITFLLISYAILIVFQNPDFLVEHYRFAIAENGFLKLNYQGYTRLTLYALANIVLLLIVFGRLRNIGKGRVLQLRMLFLIFMVGIPLTILGLGEDDGLKTILFTFCPVSIFITNYFEIFKRKRLKEYLLLLVIIGPVLISIWKLFA